MVYAQRQSEVAAARLPAARVVYRPEHPVDGVDRGVSQAGARVDRDQAARRAAIEHVARMQVAVQQHRHAGIGDERSRELVAPAESLDRNGAGQRLAAPAVSFDPVLEDELDPLGL